jgi:hypothetical protein
MVLDATSCGKFLAPVETFLALLLYLPDVRCGLRRVKMTTRPNLLGGELGIAQGTTKKIVCNSSKVLALGLPNIIRHLV